MILAYPFLVLLGPPVFFSVFWIRAFFEINCSAGICGLLTIPIPLIVGLVVDIFWIPFALVALPALGIFMIAHQQFERVKTKRKAMRRIREIIENNRKLVAQ